MDYDEFLERVVDEGIAAAKADYKKEEDKLRLQGSIEGFEACRGKTPEELKKLLEDAQVKGRDAFLRADEIGTEEYWRIRSYEDEIEWTANVVSAMLANEGRPPLSPFLPTARGVFKAAEIVGIRPVHAAN